MRRRRSLCNKSQLEVIDDSVHHGVVGEEGDDLHRPSASRADHGVEFKDFPDHLGPAFKKKAPEPFLSYYNSDKPLPRM